MTSQQLLTFLAVAECLNYRKAAEQLYVTQPAVSKQIITLEKELDFPLFKRNKRDVVLTPAGELFYKYARFSYDQLEKVLEECRAIKKNHAIEICCEVSLRSEIINEAAIRFFRQYPASGIRFEYCDTSDMVNAISTKAFDVYVSHIEGLPKYIHDLDHTLLEVKNFGFLAKKGYMNVFTQTDDSSVFNGCEFFDPISKPRFGDDIGKSFSMPSEARLDRIRRLGLDPQKFTMKSNWQSVMASVKLGLGVTMVDEDIYNELPDGYIWIKNTKKALIQAFWYSYNDKPELSRFLSILKEVQQENPLPDEGTYDKIY